MSLEELGRRAVACKHWWWMGGMAVIDRPMWRDRYHAMRADVGLSGDIEDEIAVAYRRGAEAMREHIAEVAWRNAALEWFVELVRALPIPEEP